MAQTATESQYLRACTSIGFGPGIPCRPARCCFSVKLFRTGPLARYTPKIPDWPESERPRERLIKFGAAGLSDAEILAILLRVGNREITAIDLARKIINDFNGFRGLDSRSVAEMCEINGVGPAKAAQIKAAIELGKR